MDHLEAAAAGFEAGWGGSSEEDSSDCRAVVCRMGGQKGGGGPASGQEITCLGVCRVPEVA